MKVRIQKWGNSLALRIPKSLAAKSEIAYGSVVEVFFQHGQIIVEPIADTDYTLQELLAGVSKYNLHAGINTDTVLGKEVW
jgi:antitoxin MazE